MDEKTGGCFFCTDCDATRCEDEVLAKLRHIAEQAGKRHWWNVLFTIQKLNDVALRSLHRDINGSAQGVAAAACGKEASPSSQ